MTSMYSCFSILQTPDNTKYNFLIPAKIYELNSLIVFFRKSKKQTPKETPGDRPPDRLELKYDEESLKLPNTVGQVTITCHSHNLQIQLRIPDGQVGLLHMTRNKHVALDVAHRILLWIHSLYHRIPSCRKINVCMNLNFASVQLTLETQLENHLECVGEEFPWVRLLVNLCQHRVISVFFEQIKRDTTWETDPQEILLPYVPYSPTLFYNN